jgi:DNA mismatch repair protein MutS
MAADAQLTPMMAQYRRIKSELPADALLLFRLGDFYEMFFEDAQAGARLLHVALTQRGGVPMCGIPFHATEAYISRLLRAGRKVAICDQIEEARPGQLVKREVTQILSPGTHFDERLLTSGRNHFLGAICSTQGRYGIAMLDLTTGEFRCTEVDADTALLAELDRLRPAEVIIPAAAADLRDVLVGAPGVLTSYEDWTFAPETAQFTLREHFQVASLDGFGLRDRLAAIGAAGAALHYVQQHLRRPAGHLITLTCYDRAEHLCLDTATLRHLEVLEPLRRDGPAAASLFAVLNRTCTPMGARRLREWLTRPLATVAPIRRRQAAVKAWLDAPAALDQWRQQLGALADVERTLSRLSVGTGNARDLSVLGRALEQIPALRDTARAAAAAARAAAPLLEDAPPPPAAGLLPELAEELSPESVLTDLIARAIVETPPLSVKEGGLIRDGFDAALDELHDAARGGKEWIARLQQQEIERTGIASLKVRFNSVFGYYIEVTRANLAKVPPEYVRKQTIANGERYFTPELKTMEGRILGAEERAATLEYELFLRVRDAVLERLPSIQRTARAIAQLDALGAFAEVARLHNYCRPHVADQGLLRIRDGRHPVLDQALSDERFVPNDTDLDPKAQQIELITGPNMAGKSTYIRQVALISLMAHVGAFVPAAEARIDLLDRIFTRIGASDDLARGQSTFMVEMSETANILNNATAASLIILDEIGRGTSTFDGLSLAWSIVEHLHHVTGAKTLFATHYHELTELAGRLPRLRNSNVAVREWNDQVVFLRKILPGATDKSYGIQVARLAGVPKPVVTRAKEILRNLEESELTPEGKPRVRGRQRAERATLQALPPPPQLDLFARLSASS